MNVRAIGFASNNFWELFNSFMSEYWVYNVEQISGNKIITENKFQKYLY